MKGLRAVVAPVPKVKPIITVGEARKLLGSLASDITNDELSELILQQEQIIRFIFSMNKVRK